MPLNFDYLRDKNLMAPTPETPGAGEIEIMAKYNRDLAKLEKAKQAEAIYNKNQNSLDHTNVSGSILENWDYKNQQLLGPMGQPLPGGALGWLPDGSPNFGSGIKGWLRKLQYDMSAPSQGWSSDTIIDWETPKQYWVQKMIGVEAEPVISTAPNTAETLKNLWEHAIRWNPESGEKSPGEKISTITSALIKGGLAAIGEFAEAAIEKPIFGLAKGFEEAGEGSPLPKINLDEKLGWVGRLLEASPVMYAYNSMRTLTSPIPWDTKKNILLANYEAGRIAYSSLFYPELQQEYVRRLNEGENALALELELQNPTIELVGELIMDPLNIIDYVSGAMRFAGKMDDIFKSAFKIAPELADALRTVGKIDDLDEIAVANKFVNAAEIMQQQNVKMAQGLTEYAKKIGLTVPTSTAKQQQMMVVMGRALQHIIGTYGGDPDDVAKFVINLAKMSGNNVDEIKIGMAYASKYPSSELPFTEAFRELGYVVRKLIGETPEGLLDDGSKFMKILQDAGGDLEKLATDLDKAIAPILNNLFPDIGKRIKLHDDAIKLQKAGKELNVAQQVAANEKFSSTARAISSFHTKAQKFYKGANTTQAALYMGLSPGYAARNVFNNTLTSIVDWGVAQYRKIRKKDWIDEIHLWLNGAENPKMLQGISSAGSADMYKGTKGMVGIEMAQAGEIDQSVRISGHVIEQTMKRMLRRLGANEILRAAGATVDQVGMITDTLIKEYGNVTRTVEKFRDWVDKGVVAAKELPRRWLKLDDVKLMDNFGIGRAVDNAIAEGDDVEKVVAKVNEHFDELLSKAEKLIDEVGEISDDNVAKDAIAHLSQALDSGDVSGGTVEIAGNVYQATTNAINELKKGIGTLYKAIGDELSALKTPEADELLTKIKGVVLDKFYIAVDGYAGNDGLIDLTSKNSLLFNKRWIDEWYNPKLSMAVRAETLPNLKLFNELKASGLVDLSNVPIPTTYGELKTLFWENFYTIGKNDIWKDAREGLAALVKSTADDVLKLYTPKDGGGEILERAYKALEDARRWDNNLMPMIIRQEVQEGLKAGDNARVIRAYARQFNIATATEAGIPLDNKSVLNIINKNLPEGMSKFSKLDDVPTNVAYDALNLHNYKNTAKAAEAVPEAVKYGKNVNAIQDEIASLSKQIDTIPQKRLDPSAGYEMWKTKVQKGRAIDATDVLDVKDLEAREKLAALQAKMDDIKGVLDNAVKDNPSATKITSKYERNINEIVTNEGRFELIGSGANKEVYKSTDGGKVLKIGSKESVVNEFVIMDKYSDTGLFPNVYGVNKYNNDYYYLIADYISPVKGVSDIKFIEENAEIINRAENLLGVGDLRGISQWGITDDGKLVILDAYDWKSAKIQDELAKGIDILNNEIDPLAKLTNGIFKSSQGYNINSLDDLEDVVASLNKRLDNIKANMKGDLGEYANLYEENLKATQSAIKNVEDFINNKPSQIVDETKRLISPEIQASMYRMQRPIAEAAPEAGKVAEEIPDILKAPDDLIPPYSGSRPTLARNIFESQDEINRVRASVIASINDNFSRTIEIAENPQLEKALEAWAKAATKDVSDARWVAMNYADAARDFTLLSYQKTGFDVIAGYIFPYQYWYSRTYLNWMKRVVQHPGVIAAYAKYRKTLEQLHAGTPDWWKYNINTNELLGIDSENPLFFNLEATFNPLNGLTGVDFNDRYRRINWWTAFIDDFTKFGPSTWMPYNLSVAAILAMQGEKDAAARWAGRLSPITGAFKALTGILGIGDYGGIEADPLVWLFSGGIDPHERNRIGRALGWMIESGQITQEQALDAAYSQSGDLWDAARKWQADQRNWGQLGSYFFGTGFKARNVYDIQIDVFWNDYFKLLNQRGILSSDEFRFGMDGLREQYPFMDTVLLSRNPGDFARDTAYAYNVLARIPPGRKDDILKMFGMSYDVLQKFYEDKGTMESWSVADRTQFMSMISQMGAILSMPDSATRREWTSASVMYGKLSDAMKEMFGEDIEQKIDHYFALLASDTQGRNAANQFLQDNPEVTQAMTFKDGAIIRNPILSQYYTSVSKIEGYYNGMMYNEIRQKCGDDIWDKWDLYNQLKLTGGSRQFWKENPELKLYMEIKNKWSDIINDVVIDLAKKLESPEWSKIREDATGGKLEEVKQLIEESQSKGYYGMTKDDWREVMSEPLWNLVMDNLLLGKNISETAYSQLEYIADDMELDVDFMLELIDQAQ